MTIPSLHWRNLLYDAENRLVEVKKNSVTMATFVYDGDGRRVPFGAYLAQTVMMK